MTDFSANQPPPTNFRPGPGQQGAAAAMHQGRPGPGRPSTGNHPSSKSRSGAEESPIGTPSPEAQQSNAHEIQHWAAWQNSRDLGRDLSYALWAKHTGLGPRSWDLFWDGVP